MQASFTKYWKEIRKGGLDESQVHQLCEQILANLTDDDPAWVTHVTQALTNKGVASADIKRVLLELKDMMLDENQRNGETS